MLVSQPQKDKFRIGVYQVHYEPDAFGDAKEGQSHYTVMALITEWHKVGVS